MVGFATLEALLIQWRIWTRQIEPIIEGWSDETMATVLTMLAPIETFIAELRERLK